MKKPPLEKLLAILIGFGVIGLVLLIAVETAGVAGGAAIVVALSTLGGPLGMIGGLALLAVLLLISKGLAENGFEAIFRGVLRGLKKKGLSKADIISQIESYPISRSLKAKLKEYVTKLWPNGNSPGGSVPPSDDSPTMTPPAAMRKITFDDM